MKCPKCAIGNIVTARFKLSGEKASLCDKCDALWFLGEGLNPKRAHNFRAFSKDFELDHSLEKSDEDHSSIYFKAINSS